MKHPIRIHCIALLASLACGSCGDAPELVEKRERQKTEIARLTGELALIEEKLKNLPPDVSEDLEKAKKTADEQTALVQTLETEVKQLQERKRLLQGEFDAYRAKYQIK